MRADLLVEEGLAGILRLELVRPQDCVGLVEQRLDLSRTAEERDIRISVNHLSRAGPKKPAKIAPVTAVQSSVRCAFNGRASKTSYPWSTRLMLRRHIGGTLIFFTRFVYFSSPVSSILCGAQTGGGTLEGIAMDDRHGHYFEDLATGMSAVFSKTVTEADLLMFAGVSGDTNPLHLDEDFASRTIFESRIAHGMLTASLISTVLGTRLPGPGAVYVSQNIRFLAPVRIGDTVIARAQVAELVEEKRRVRMTTVCMVGDKKVMDGEAVLMVPIRPNGPE
jgi:3-hydroxybutyryl-CoA dehydratase